jgi:hypothetical protein
MPDEKKADVTLHDGKEITFDFYKINISDWRTLFDDGAETTKEFAEKVGRVCNLTADELSTLPFPDYRLLMNTFWKRSQDPLTDPKNSQSVPS